MCCLNFMVKQFVRSLLSIPRVGIKSKSEVLKHKSSINDYTTPSARTMHKKTHLISKVKPIRIIHIFAPEIIKINAESFREVVQRLTGKPTEDNMAKKSNKRMDVGGCMRIKGEEEIWRGSNSSGGFSAEIDGFMQDIFNQFPIVEEY